MSTINSVNCGLSGATGTGNFVGSNSASLITPSLGTPSNGILTNCTGLPVAGGGTGNNTFTAYSVITGGTTSTTPFQNVSGVGTSNQVLTSNGTTALPSWKAPTIGLNDPAYSIQTPSTGFTITMGNTITTLILAPAGALASGTIILAAIPVDGQIIRICSAKLITLLAVNANTGQSIVASPVTLALGGGFSYIYTAGSTTWYRLY